jgi:hypothetical protein
MIKNWLTWIYLGLLSLSVLLILFGFAINLSRPNEIPIGEIAPEKTTLPKGGFRLEQQAYDELGPPLMGLKFSPMTLQLPDLRNYLVYYGRNERPDASEEQSMLHFSFVGSKEIASIAPEKPLYLVYDKDQPRVKYRFSPGNAVTSFWFEAVPESGESSINMAMKNEAGEIIRKPEQHAQFKLKEKQFSRFGTDRWELGKWKVDGTLLARQRARWYGQDLFLERHGGDEYKNLKEKQRIDFGQDEETYSVFIGAGNALAWKNDRWEEVQPGVETQKYPLLVVEKIDERLMKLALWDVDGTAKVSLNLIKSSETTPPLDIPKTFKFVGARTRSQLMFEVNDVRMIISPKDWLLLTEGKWIKLATPEEIDAFVERKISGPLFVVDEIAKEEGRQILMGTLFNATRTEMKSVEIPLQQGIGSSVPSPKSRNEGKSSSEENPNSFEEPAPEGDRTSEEREKQIKDSQVYREQFEKSRERHESLPDRKGMNFKNVVDR